MEKMNKKMTSTTNILTGEQQDRGNLVYFAFYYIGFTILFPYNMLIVVTDFWNYKFRNTSQPFNSSSDELTEMQKSFPGYLALVANVPLALCVVLTALIGWAIKLKTRVISLNLMMAISLGSLVGVAAMDSDTWQHVLYAITLALFTVYCSFNAVYQASFLGNLGRFPPRYIGCCNDGGAFAGVIPPIVNIIVLAFNPPPQAAGLFCMSLAVIVWLVALPLYYFASKTPFYIHHSGIHDTSAFKRPSLKHYLFVLRKSWGHVYSTFACYAVTLSAYPAVSSLVRPVSTSPSTWNDIFFVPVSCFLTLALSEWVGRSLATFSQWPRPSAWADAGVALAATSRMAAVPLFMFCNVAPSNRSTQILFDSDWAYIGVNILFGLSGGYLGNVALMLGPKKVDVELQEAAGFVLVIALVAGLGVGSVVGPLLVSLL